MRAGRLTQAPHAGPWRWCGDTAAHPQHFADVTAMNPHGGWCRGATGGTFAWFHPMTAFIVLRGIPTGDGLPHSREGYWYDRRYDLRVRDGIQADAGRPDVLTLTGTGVYERRDSDGLLAEVFRPGGRPAPVRRGRTLLGAIR